MNEPFRDEDGLRDQLQAHHGQSWSWALACCRGDAVAAEEALQVTYQKALDGRARYGGRSSFKTWLFGVIRLTALDERRRTWRQWLRLVPLSEAERQPHAMGALDEEGEQVRTALAGLAERQGQVLRLVFYHGLTLDEAAATMGVSPGTARTHYERGKERLRRRLGATGGRV